MQSAEFKRKSAQQRQILLLAEKIYGRRKDLGLTQTELAKRAETTQRIISELEEGLYIPTSGIGEDLYNKLAIALEIDRDYLLSDKINRRTFELFAYIGTKLRWKWDIMQFMKIPYFVDLRSIKELGFQISNFEYIRYEYGPFDKKMYNYRALFEGKSYSPITYSYISDFIDNIESALSAIPIHNGNQLKKLSYETAPMKQCGATLGGKENIGMRLVLKSMKKNKTDHTLFFQNASGADIEKHLGTMSKQEYNYYNAL